MMRTHHQNVPTMGTKLHGMHIQYINMITVNMHASHCSPYKAPSTLEKVLYKSLMHSENPTSIGTGAAIGDTIAPCGAEPGMARAEPGCGAAAPGAAGSGGPGIDGVVPYHDPR